jgi:hypothetical protein
MVRFMTVMDSVKAELDEYKYVVQQQMMRIAELCGRCAWRSESHLFRQ